MGDVGEAFNEYRKVVKTRKKSVKIKIWKLLSSANLNILLI